MWAGRNPPAGDLVPGTCLRRRFPQVPDPFSPRLQPPCIPIPSGIPPLDAAPSSSPARLQLTPGVCAEESPGCVDRSWSSRARRADVVMVPGQLLASTIPLRLRSSFHRATRHPIPHSRISSGGASLLQLRSRSGRRGLAPLHALH